MNIEFSTEEYEKLMALVYLGEWMVNGYKVGDEHEYGYREIKEKVLSQAEKFGITKFKENKGNDAYTKVENGMFFGTNVMDYVDDYKEESFWEQLRISLAARDFVEKYNEKAIEQMSKDEYLEKLDVLEEACSEEFCEHGVDRLRIVPEPK